MALISYQIDITDVERLVNQEIPAAIFKSLEQSAQIFEESAYIIIQAVFAEAIALAGDGWPVAYTSHLDDAVKDLPIDVNVTPTTLQIGVDLDIMGDKNDLIKAWHYKAKLEEGGYVELPFEGTEDDLANDQETRLEVFQREVAGKGLTWDITMDRRVETWVEMGKAPEWLVLQYGVPYDPVIPPFNLEGEIESRLAIEAETSVATLMNIAIGQIDSIGRIALSSDVALELRGKSPRLTSIQTGQFTKNPNPR